MEKMQRLKAKRMGRIEKKRKREEAESDNESDSDGDNGGKQNKRQWIRDQLTHESFFRITKAKRAARFAHWKKSIEQEENELRSMYPKHIREEIEKEKAEERKHKKKLT